MRPQEDIPIHSFDQCVNLYKKLDKKNNASTYIYKSRVSDIVLRERNITPDENLHNVLYGLFHYIEPGVKLEFNSYNNKNKFSDEIWGIYTVYKNIILTKSDFIFPIVAKLLPNKKFVVHPGTKRLLVASYHNPIVEVLITDYNVQGMTNISLLEKYFKYNDKSKKLFLRKFNELRPSKPSVKAYPYKLVHYELMNNMRWYDKDFMLSYDCVIERTKNNLLIN